MSENKSDGSTASYYELPAGATELQRLISHRNMNAQIGEIFRACYRYGMASHSDQLRDAKKILFYAKAEVERLDRQQAPARPAKTGRDLYYQRYAAITPPRSQALVRDWMDLSLVEQMYWNAKAKEQEGGWIEWKGGKCPVHPPFKVDYKNADGKCFLGVSAGLLYWFHDMRAGDISAYRIAKEQA
jgi:hypothetical protein